MSARLKALVALARWLCSDHWNVTQKRVRARCAPRLFRTAKDTLQPIIKENVEPGSAVYTDEHLGYSSLSDQDYIHAFVKHAEYYVNGAVHTNGIENFWTFIEVDREVGIKGHQLCRQYAAHELYPNDAIHLACAIRGKCDVLLTWDTPLVGVSHPDIRIEEPAIYDRTLFTESEIATEKEIKEYAEKQKASSFSA